MKLNIVLGFCGLVLLASVVRADNLVGKNAPDIVIREWVTSNPPDVKNMANKVYVLEFWATWCSPCVRNIPHLIKLTDKYKNKGVEFISLSQDKSEKELRKFVKKKKINYHVAIDYGSTDLFKIESYPTAFVVNHKGLIVWRGSPSHLGFEKAITKAVAAIPASRFAKAD